MHPLSSSARRISSPAVKVTFTFSSSSRRYRVCNFPVLFSACNKLGLSDKTKYDSFYKVAFYCTSKPDDKSRKAKEKAVNAKDGVAIPSIKNQLKDAIIKGCQILRESLEFIKNFI